MPFHAGRDWGGTSLAVCVINRVGQVVVSNETHHDNAGLAILARLKRVVLAADLPIAIERPSGLIVDALAAAGPPVILINPNTVKACQPRYRAAAPIFAAIGQNCQTYNPEHHASARRMTA